MLIVDILLVVAILGFIGAGYKDGLVHTFGRTLSAILGFVAAKYCFVYAIGPVSLFVPQAWSKTVAFIVVFIVVYQFAGFLFRLVDGVFKILSALPFLKSMDAFLGAILGSIEGVVIIGGASFFILSYHLEPHLVAWLQQSTVAFWTQKIFQFVLGFLL